MLRFASLAFGILLFFSPATGQNAAEQTPAQQAAPPAFGVADNLYRNPTFGFSYKVPFGWVHRTAEIQDNSSSSNEKDKDAKARVLLAVFERPPEVIGDTVNSAVVIAAESSKSYPGLKSAVDYFAPLEEITKAKGFKALSQPYEFTLGTKNLARQDFSRERGKLTMHQATLVLLHKGYIVSFTFIGDSEDEVEELVQGLNFSGN